MYAVLPRNIYEIPATAIVVVAVLASIFVIYHYRQIRMVRLLFQLILFERAHATSQYYQIPSAGCGNDPISSYKAAARFKYDSKEIIQQGYDQVGFMELEIM